MKKIKPQKSYHLSVEGETEEWYFEHLKNLINHSEDARFRVSFDVKRGKTPKSVLKSLSLSSYKEAVVFQICDYESNDGEHTRKFLSALSELKDIRTECRTTKCIKEFSLGYSNFTFDLWMALHKKQFISPVAHRRNYRDFINSAFGTNYQYIDEYKNEHEFKSILSKIQLQDVIGAVKNAEDIRKKNEETKQQSEYKGFTYYRDNPDFTINIIVKRILMDCRINIL